MTRGYKLTVVARHIIARPTIVVAGMTMIFSVAVVKSMRMKGVIHMTRSRSGMTMVFSVAVVRSMRMK